MLRCKYAICNFTILVYHNPYSQRAAVPPSIVPRDLLLVRATTLTSQHTFSRFRGHSPALSCWEQHQTFVIFTWIWERSYGQNFSLPCLRCCSDYLFLCRTRDLSAPRRRLLTTRSTTKAESSGVIDGNSSHASAVWTKSEGAHAIFFFF